MSDDKFTTSLKGKVAIVTGSSSGIGAAIARRLASNGAKVVINYANNAERAEALARELNGEGNEGAIAIKADTSTLEGGRHLIDETIRVLGKLDILICNAGIMGSKPIVDVDEKFFDVHFQTNVKAPFFMVKYAIPRLPTPGGRIIFVSSSLTGSTAVLPNAVTYAATKGAIEQISRVLAKDLGGRGITVNTVSPGSVDTELFRAGKPQHIIDMIAGQNPTKRLGLPEDIAPTFAFLASPAAQWVNGQNYRVNGAFVV